FSPDGKTLAVCVGVRSPDKSSGKSEIRLWDIAARMELRRWSGASGPHAHLVSIAFSPDGKWVTTGGADHSVRQWEVESGKESRPAIHPYRYAGKVAYLDATTLITHGAQNVVHSWDAV